MKRNKDDKKEKKNGGIVFRIIMIMLIICCLLGGLYFIKLGRQQEELSKAGVPSVKYVIDEWYYYVEEDARLLDEYQDYNSDVVGIIRIEDSILNHPFVWTPDDEDYYLYKDLNKDYNSHGVPFLSAGSKVESLGTNMVMYGHNIRLITRDIFADLTYYEDIEYYKKHPYIETVTDTGNRKWLIVAYFITDNSEQDAFRYSEYLEYETEDDFAVYWQKVQKRNWIDVNVDVEYGDTLLTLSSCSVENAGSGTNRMVVIAKLMRTTEDFSTEVESGLAAEDPLLPASLRGSSLI